MPSYDKEIIKKQAYVEKLLSGLVPEIEPVVRADNPLHYRKKVHAAVGISRGKVIAGTYEPGTHRIIDGGGNDLAYYTYLEDVYYQVRAHFEWNMNRPELEKDRNEHKHHNIAKRMIELSGLRPNTDIEIKYIGLRPGEKLYEELLYNKSRHPPLRIHTGTADPLP